jgi:DNA-binding MarR family transcriptional regulator
MKKTSSVDPGVDRYGPLRPSGLGRSAGFHPATMTGIIDRLESGGWISRGYCARRAAPRSR